jgi:hypothetical protein
LETLGDGTGEPHALGRQLRDLSASTEDRDLRVYLRDVSEILESPFLTTLGENGSLRLPLGHPPFKTLVEYCQCHVVSELRE